MKNRNKEGKNKKKQVATRRADSQSKGASPLGAWKRLAGMPVCSKTLRSTRFNYTADSCPCSLGGCTSLWPCTASRLCFKHDLPSAAVAASHRAAALGSATASSDLDGDGGGRGSHGVTYLFFLSFNRSLVRNAFASNPWKARAREVNRVLWFMHTARAVGVRPSRRHPIAPAA